MAELLKKSLTKPFPYNIIFFVLKKICASGSAVEHLLAKEGVAGSIPVSRSCKKPEEIKGFLFFYIRVISCEC